MVDFNNSIIDEYSSLPISEITKLIEPYIKQNLRYSIENIPSSIISKAKPDSSFYSIQEPTLTRSLQKITHKTKSQQQQQQEEEEMLTDDSATISTLESVPELTHSDSTSYVSANSSFTSISTDATLTALLSESTTSSVTSDKSSSNNSKINNVVATKTTYSKYIDNLTDNAIFCSNDTLTNVSGSPTTALHFLSYYFDTLLNRNDGIVTPTTNLHCNIVTTPCNNLQKQQQEKFLKYNTTSPNTTTNTTNVNKPAAPKKIINIFRSKKNHSHSSSIECIEEKPQRHCNHHYNHHNNNHSSSRRVTSSNNNNNNNTLTDASNTTLVAHPSFTTTTTNTQKPLTTTTNVTIPVQHHNQPYASSTCFRNLLLDHSNNNGPIKNTKKYAIKNNNNTIENFSIVDLIEAQFLAQSHPSTLMPVIQKLAESMSHSLYSNNSPTMLPSLLTSLPTGNERGVYLSVDVGGSTLRVALVQLFGKEAKPVALHNERHPITERLKCANGEDFFLWIGHKIKAALELCKKKSKLHHSVFNDTLNMGLSWSFPIAQLEDISRGTILTMGKGYKVADQIAGKDLKDCFTKCFKTLNLNIKLTAIVNDTIASLVSHAFVSSETKAAVILGTGVNASALLPIDPADKSNKALINTELSLLGGNGILPETLWDKIVDEEVDRPGFQPFETKVSGRYLGEISRLLVNDLTRLENSDYQVPEGFGEKYGFDTAIMSEAEGYFLQGRMEEAVKLLNKSSKSGKHVFSESDSLDICRLFQAVSLRSAAFTAASLVALALNFEDDDEEEDCSTPTTSEVAITSPPTKKKPISIAYSGTVIEKYPMYKDRCQKFLDEFASIAGFEKHQLILEPALDGTLYGPAIASAMNS